MASHGTEQLMVQRLLAARSQTDSRLALFASWLVVFLQFTLFLVIGLVLFVYYQHNGAATPAVPERIYPQFVWDHLPVGLAGLVIAAILAAAMSNLSAALNALASTTVMDFYRPMRPGLAETFLSGAGALGHCGLGRDSVRHRPFWRVIGDACSKPAFRLPRFCTARLLGVFLLGLLTRRVGEWSAITGMVVGLATIFLMRQAVAYTWYVLVGSSATFLTGYLASFIFRDASKAHA